MMNPGSHPITESGRTPGPEPALEIPQWPALVALGAAAAACLMLLATRVVLTHRLEHAYLAWNLFLAWLPLAFAAAAARLHGRPVLRIASAAVWLLFLPNAPYLITDLVHLQPRPPVPLWFDIVLLQAFALTGLFLGLWSLDLMRRTASALLPPGWVVVSTLVVVALCGFGIYLGRVERWNSWDLFTQPVLLLGSIAEVVLHPFANRRAVGFSALHAGLVGAAYAIWLALARRPGGVADRPRDPESAGAHVRGAS